MSARRSSPELAEANRRCPTGRVGYWRIIRQLDDVGPWTARQVSERTYDSRHAVNIFVAKLVRHGFAEIVATLPGETNRARNVRPTNLLRLLRRPLDPPRILGLTADDAGALKVDAIWRTMKILGLFSTRVLAEEAATGAEALSLFYVRDYLTLLVSRGIVVKVGKKPANGEATYRLAVNLGGRAPRMLRGKVLFDPNSGKILVRNLGNR